MNSLSEIADCFAYFLLLEARSGNVLPGRSADAPMLA